MTGAVIPIRGPMADHLKALKKDVADMHQQLVNAEELIIDIGEKERKLSADRTKAYQDKAAARRRYWTAEDNLRRFLQDQGQE